MANSNSLLDGVINIINSPNSFTPFDENIPRETWNVEMNLENLAGDKHLLDGTVQLPKCYEVLMESLGYMRSEDGKRAISPYGMPLEYFGTPGPAYGTTGLLEVSFFALNPEFAKLPLVSLVSKQPSYSISRVDDIEVIVTLCEESKNYVKENRIMGSHYMYNHSIILTAPGGITETLTGLFDFDALERGLSDLSLDGHPVAHLGKYLDALNAPGR